MTINHAVISGNLTRDCEERRTQSGMAIVTFTVAVNERRKNNQTGEYDDYANYIGCVAFGKYAENKAPALQKGARVTVSGSLRWSQWEKDGQKRSKVEIIANDIETHTAPKQPATSHQNGSSGVPKFEEVTPTVYDSDIPF